MNTKAGTNNNGATQPGGASKNGKAVQAEASTKTAPAPPKAAKSRGALPAALASAPSAKGPQLPTNGIGPDPAAPVVEKMYRPPNILRLPGIKLSDFRPPEDAFDERLLEGVESAEGRTSPLGAEGVPFDKIPPEFTGLEDWPTSTNLKCWVCDFNFSDRPKFVALSFKDNETGGFKMGVHGVMCTFNCAELYIETHYLRLTERQHLQELLRFEYFFFTAKWVSRIKPAPSKTEMLHYGGPLDSDAFLKKLRELDPDHGLRDHTPGSILPERLRIAPGDASRAAAQETSSTCSSSVSVWDLCSVPAPGAAQRGDTASVWQLLGPGETKPGGTEPGVTNSNPGPGGAKHRGETEPDLTNPSIEPDGAKQGGEALSSKKRTGETNPVGAKTDAGGLPASPARTNAPVPGVINLGAKATKKPTVLPLTVGGGKAPEKSPKPSAQNAKKAADRELTESIPSINATAKKNIEPTPAANDNPKKASEAADRTPEITAQGPESSGGCDYLDELLG